MRPSVRFDVFKRDQFTCSYCGRKPPEVTLEVDHIIPKAEGGTDDPENLTTACWDCTAETEGRKKQCTVCGKWLAIPKGWDTSIGYHHAECEQ